jgi:hypothetical protein
MFFYINVFNFTRGSFVPCGLRRTASNFDNQNRCSALPGIKKGLPRYLATPHVTLTNNYEKTLSFCLVLQI